MIHEVDQLLEQLVRRDALNGSGVDLVFDAPTKDWVARRSGPSIDLYLYDIREDLQRRSPAWEDVRGEHGHVTDRRLPPRRFRLAYLVTAWTQRPEDEHRLLSSLLACFLKNPMVKPEDLGDLGSLGAAGLPVYLDVGQPAGQERSLADIWSALGGELKPSLDLVVTAPMVVGLTAPFGAPVLQGPTIGLAGPDAGAEPEAAGGTAGGRGRGRAAVPVTAPDVGEELLPAGSEDAPGLKLRVRGHRRS